MLVLFCAFLLCYSVLKYSCMVWIPCNNSYLFRVSKKWMFVKSYWSTSVRFIYPHLSPTWSLFSPSCFCFLSSMKVYQVFPVKNGSTNNLKWEFDILPFREMLFQWVYKYTSKDLVMWSEVIYQRLALTEDKMNPTVKFSRSWVSLLVLESFFALKQRWIKLASYIEIFQSTFFYMCCVYGVCFPGFIDQMCLF